MIVTFRKIKATLYEFKAQEKRTMYQGTVKSEPSGRGTTFISIYSTPNLGDKQDEVMNKYVQFKKGSN